MSSGQKPRWTAFFPSMKQRGKGRVRRKPRLTVWKTDSRGRLRAVWPPVMTVNGQEVRVYMDGLRVCGRMYRDGGWRENGDR